MVDEQPLSSNRARHKHNITFVDHLCYLCHVLAMLSRLVVTCWERLEGLTSWFLFVVSNCDFVTFPCGILVFAVFLTLPNHVPMFSLFWFLKDIIGNIVLPLLKLFYICLMVSSKIASGPHV